MNALHLVLRHTAPCLALLALLGAREARADDRVPAAPLDQAVPPPSVALGPTIACTAFEGPRVPPQVEPRPFGMPADVVLGNVVGLSTFSSGGLARPSNGVFLTAGWVSYSSSEYAQSPGGGRATALSISPDFDVFVGSRLSLGGQLAFGRATVRGPLESSVQAFHALPRVGWAIPLNDDFTLWTRGSVGLGASKASYDSTGADGLPARRSATLAYWRVSLDVLLVARVSRVVALTFGPTASYVELLGAPSFDVGTATTSSFNVGVSGGISLVL